MFTVLCDSNRVPSNVSMHDGYLRIQMWEPLLRWLYKCVGQHIQGLGSVQIMGWVFILQKWKTGKRRAEKDKYKGGLFFHTIEAPSVSLDAISVWVVSSLLMLFSFIQAISIAPFPVHYYSETRLLWVVSSLLMLFSFIQTIFIAPFQVHYYSETRCRSRFSALHPKGRGLESISTYEHRVVSWLHFTILSRQAVDNCKWRSTGNCCFSTKKNDDWHLKASPSSSVLKRHYVSLQNEWMNKWKTEFSLSVLIPQPATLTVKLEHAHYFNIS